MTETTKARKTPAKPRKSAAKSAPATATAKLAPAAPETQEKKTVSFSHEEIRKLAHQYWIDGGHRQGHQHEDWARAEAELRKRAS